MRVEMRSSCGRVGRAIRRGTLDRVSSACDTAFMPRTVLPDGWQRPRGYANGMAAHGELLAVAGQIGWNAQEQFESLEFVDQFRTALANVVAVVEAAGGAASDIISLTIYVTDKREYIAAIKSVGEAYRELLGKHFPAMALVVVAALLEDRAKVEIQALAVLPPSGPAPGEGSTP
jgi:enamine deaminase RidA (YjgF/YER057c/UK114 family)